MHHRYSLVKILEELGNQNVDFRRISSNTSWDEIWSNVNQTTRFGETCHVKFSESLSGILSRVVDINAKVGWCDLDLVFRYLVTR